MTDEQLNSVGIAVANVAAAFKEFRRQSHPGNGGVPPWGLLDECLSLETRRVRGAGQEQLADALEALRSDLGAMSNG